VERGATLAGNAGTIEPGHFSDRLKDSPARLPEATGGNITLSELERRHIQAVLEETGWNIQDAAGILGIHRNTLTRKIAEYGLQKKG
jgi:DNA-binding NtrC family response regulator